MTRVLVIHSATAHADSVSRRLTGEALDRLSKGKAKPDLHVLDLAKSPVPHVSDAWAAAYRTPPGMEGPGYKEATQLSDTLIADMKWADFIVLGCPMYQAGIPSVLKAWFDHVLRNGHTIELSPEGAKPLMTGKRVLGILTRGGVHSAEAGGDGFDFQKPYLQGIFGAMGYEQDYIICEGLGIPPLREAGLKAASDTIAAHAWLG